MPAIDQRRMVRRNEFDVVVGVNIRRLREQMGMSQAQLGQVADMSSSQISRLEKGERTLDLWQALKLTTIFNCQIGHLTAKFR